MCRPAAQPTQALAPVLAKANPLYARLAELTPVPVLVLLMAVSRAHAEHVAVWGEYVLNKDFLQLREPVMHAKGWDK